MHRIGVLSTVVFAARNAIVCLLGPMGIRMNAHATRTSLTRRRSPSAHDYEQSISSTILYIYIHSYIYIYLYLSAVEFDVKIMSVCTYCYQHMNQRL